MRCLIDIVREKREKKNLPPSSKILKSDASLILTVQSIFNSDIFLLLSHPLSRPFSTLFLGQRLLQLGNHSSIYTEIHPPASAYITMEGFAPNIPVPMENVPAATAAAHISEKPPQSTENASLEAAKDIIYGSVCFFCCLNPLSFCCYAHTSLVFCHFSLLSSPANAAIQIYIYIKIKCFN